MSEEKIVNRIKKMMALANDPAASDGERENALRMSYALLAKHNLDMADVQGKPMGPQEARQQQASEFYGRPWAISVAAAVGDLFFCKYYFRPSGKNKAIHTFTGKESNAQAALDVAESLVRSIYQEATRKMRAADESVAWRRSFATGAMFKIRDRIREMQSTAPKELATSTALVLVGLRDSEKAANELFLVDQGVTLKMAPSRAKRTVSMDAYAQGKEFGSKLNLAPTKKLS